MHLQGWGINSGPAQSQRAIKVTKYLFKTKTQLINCQPNSSGTIAVVFAFSFPLSCKLNYHFHQYQLRLMSL